MDNQITIKNRVFLEGVGLHTGQRVKMEFLPAPAQAGIVFVRKDVSPEVHIKADLASMISPENYPRRTSISAQGYFVHTIEHLMAALHLLSIDNIQINVWGEEIPGMDGSSKDFVNKLTESGLCEQDMRKSFFVIREPLWVEENGASIVILPSPQTRISYTLEYNNPFINTGFLDILVNGELSEKIYEARTFCLEEEVEPLVKIGLGKGANHENTLVVSKKGIVKNKLRFDDEFVKHKVLDLLGDLYLAGPIRGHVIACKTGHQQNIKLLQRLRKYREKILSGAIISPSKFSLHTSQLSVEEIKNILPHRYPFLLVDRIVDLEEGKRAVGIKNVTINDYFFQGHFPNKPVMPGVLIVEAMAQVGGVLMLVQEDHRKKLAYFMSADKVKFRKTVEPGDQIVIEACAGKIRQKTGTVIAKAYVQEKIVAEGELMFALVDAKM